MDYLRCVQQKYCIKRDNEPCRRFFEKKPLNLHTIEKNIDTLFNPVETQPSNLPFFYLNSINEKNALENKKYLIKGHELMFIYFYLCFIRFSGTLELHYPGSTDQILFRDGNICSFKSEDKESYIGVLLVKNNLVGKEDIKKLLREETDIPLGERLVTGCYISPHHLQKILRDQLAIRLFKAMNPPSVTIICCNFVTSKKINYAVELNIKNLFRLVDNWVKSKVNIQWLKDFFDNNKEVYIKPLTKPPNAKQFIHYPGLKFLGSSPIKGSKTVEEVLNDMDNMTEE